MKDAGATFAPGVRRSSAPILARGSDGLWTTRYVGAPDDLVAAEVLRPEQLPGEHQTTVAFFADGAAVPPGEQRAWAQPGYTCVRRVGRRQLCVTRTTLEGDALAAREAAELALRRCWPFKEHYGRPPC